MRKQCCSVEHVFSNELTVDFTWAHVEVVALDEHAAESATELLLSFLEIKMAAKGTLC